MSVSLTRVVVYGGLPKTSLQFPTIFYMEERCGVVEITFPTNVHYKSPCDVVWAII